ncbi:hypothetical protein DPEC_G00081970, partial [Dallia pectoralis]
HGHQQRGHRGGHGHQQRGHRGGHGHQQRGHRGGHGHQQRGHRGGHGHQQRGHRGGHGHQQRGHRGGQRATVQVPGQREGNISMCAAISEDGVVGRRQTCQGEGVTYVIVWDNVSFHHAEVVQAWFQARPRFMTLYLPPYSPFLNPIEELFSAWRWKVYDRQPLERATLLQAMDYACEDINVDQCQAWIRHAKRFFPRCLNNEDIHCDVDENLWPNAQDRLDPN